jgi:hypothetical protein
MPTDRPVKTKPVRPLRAYEFYRKINRSKIIREHPMGSFENLEDIIKDHFNNLSIDELNVYLDMEARDIDRYQREMIKYKNKI